MTKITIDKSEPPSFPYSNKELKRTRPKFCQNNKTCKTYLNKTINTLGNLPNMPLLVLKRYSILNDAWHSFNKFLSTPKRIHIKSKIYTKGTI